MVLCFSMGLFFYLFYSQGEVFMNIKIDFYKMVIPYFGSACRLRSGAYKSRSNKMGKVAFFLCFALSSIGFLAHSDSSNYLAQNRGLSEAHSCLQAISIYYDFFPPVAYVGELNNPDPNLVAQKIDRARGLWAWVLKAPSPLTPAVSDKELVNTDCVQKTRKACWDYCHVGVGHGPLDLYCIFEACTGN